MTHFASDLTKWMEDAQHAVDTAPKLTVDQLFALASQPETSGRDGTHRSTWWLEESERVQREQIRDKMPSDPTELELWRERQDRRRNEIEALLDAHAEALIAARVLPKPKTTRPGRKKRLTAADAALTMTQEDAA